jgi:hypothetical protein
VGERQACGGVDGVWVGGSVIAGGRRSWGITHGLREMYKSSLRLKYVTAPDM